VELYIHPPPNTPSWRGAQLNHRDLNFDALGWSPLSTNCDDGYGHLPVP
jgi:hypothetical protein